MKQTLFTRFTVDKLATLYEEASDRLIAEYRRKKLNNTDFTIISNNCWGGHVYRRYGLPYSSPTVGMYFFSDDYIYFLEHLEESLRGPIEMINAADSKHAVELEKRGQMHIPIGRISDHVDVIFLHCQTKQEAYEKWTRRCERVNLNNLIVKFSEMNMCEESHIERFEELPFKKKILLLAKPHEGIHSGIVVNRYTRGGYEISNDTLYYDKFVNLEYLINS